MRLRFGKLKLALPYELRDGRVYVLCKCDCGADVWMRADKLENRASCGCLARDRTRKTVAKRTSRVVVPPDLRSTRQCWRAMRYRCSDPKEKYYHGRGVTVCERWQKSFTDFIADVGPRPSPKHSIDRYPNRNGNYEPGNVRWATMSEQNYNRRPRVPRTFLEYNGESLSYPELMRRTGLSLSTLRHRIREGWSAERIMTQPGRVTRKAAAKRAA